jgi:8-oxo-dGTP pyrophosphatase MutT (NUDIX family)
VHTPKPIEGFRRYLNRRRPGISEVVRETTAGGVVWRRNKQGEVEILLLQDIKGRWSIPKGHIEEGEKPEETAKREITEETGLTEMRIMSWLGKTNFRYRRQNSLVLMTTQVYLVEAKGNTEAIQKEEIYQSLEWKSVNEALELIQYEDIGKLILLGLKKIRNAGL